MATQWRDIETPLRAWLKTQPTLLPLTGNGKYIYFEAPPVDDRPDHWLTFRRLGGAPMPSHTPLDDSLISFSCYGRTRHGAAQLAEAVANVMTIEQPTPMPDSLTETVVALHGQVALWRWEPDSRVEPPVPRFVVDVALLYRAA